jgi:predicted nucleic acid-binding protein
MTSTGGSLSTSPLTLPFVIDNAAISALHVANALTRVLSFWPGRWFVPIEVKAEAEAWPDEGRRVAAVLTDLRVRGVITETSIEPVRDGALFTQLNRSLGAGESAAICIAFRCGYGVVLDDRAARRACGRLVPPVLWLATEGVLELAVSEKHLTRDEARRIWQATLILDPKRQTL